MLDLLLVITFDWIVIERIAAALLIGTIVGVERELRDKPVGMRTMILICVGASVFSLVSQRMGGVNADPTRIAAQIVTGVGFLGAGAIFRSTKSIHGLTTAATIWMVAAVGMACGFGEFGIAFLSGFSMLAVLWILHLVEERIDEVRNTQKYRIATSDPEVGFGDVDRLFNEAELKVLTRNCYQEGNTSIFSIRSVGSREKHVALREKLLRLERFQLLRT